MAKRSVGQSAGFILCLALTSVIGAAAQGIQPSSGSLSVHYEELTGPDFIQAVAKSGSTCIIPLGILEKHGPHLPLGTDLLDSREVAVRAAQKEYTLVFPQYYFGQIFEAKHQPGTIAYSEKLIWDLLQETCDELSRNGIKKIILVNGHGGNNNFIQFFCQAQLASRKDYAVLIFNPSRDPEANEKIKKLRKTTMESHAGEMETSTVLAHRPDLVHLERAKDQSGEDLKRLQSLPDIYAGIWWYASFPNHYAGDGSPGNKELGELLINNQVEALVKVIASVKKDTNVLELQKRFYDEAENPLKTKQ
jgi:creatinine amidohydrolase